MNNRELVVIGDFIARIGSSNNSQIIGRFGEEDCNANGARLIDLCEKDSLKITTGFFQHKEIYNFTWTQTNRKFEINYLLCYS